MNLIWLFLCIFEFILVIILFFIYEKKVKELNGQIQLQIKTQRDLERLKSVQIESLYIKELNEILKEKNKIDAMTQIYNKQAICDEIEALLVKKIPFSILMFDIDKFKNVNDTFGHVCGDKCIKKLALISKTSIREDDFIGRYGGDEFVIILPKVNNKYGLEIAEKLRKNIEENINPIKFTVTIGVSSYISGITTIEEVFEAVDLGLYKGKENGRNKVEIGRNIEK